MASYCIDCGKKVSRPEYTRCRKCKDIYWHGKNTPFWKEKKKCLDCGKELSKTKYTRCGSCRQKGNLNNQYKNGRMITGEGYITLLMPNHPNANNKGRYFEHRYIMEQKLGRYLLSNETVDHINGIKTDNRIENLRLANRSQNAANQKLSIRNTSGYKGVGVLKNGTFVARIKYKQKLLHIGTYENIIEAAHAYDKKALELFGEFAYLNFPQK